MPREKMFKYFDGERDRYYEYKDGRWVEIEFVSMPVESHFETVVNIVKDQRDSALRELEKYRAANDEAHKKIEWERKKRAEIEAEYRFSKENWVALDSVYNETREELEREKASRKAVAEKLENAEKEIVELKRYLSVDGHLDAISARLSAQRSFDAAHERAKFYEEKCWGLEKKVNELERRLSLEQAAHLESERALRERMNEIRDSQNEDARVCAIGFRLNHHNGCLCSRCLDAMKASEKYWNKTAAPDDRIK